MNFSELRSKERVNVATYLAYPDSSPDFEASGYGRTRLSWHQVASENAEESPTISAG